MKAASYAGHRTFTDTEGQSIPPGRGEIRINVAYAGIGGTDVHIFHGAMDQRVRLPQIIGHAKLSAMKVLLDCRA